MTDKVTWRDKLVHVTDWKNILEHINSELDNREYNRECGWFEENPGWHLPACFDWFVAAYEVMDLRVRSVICEFRGHDYESDGGDPENGREDFSCVRVSFQGVALRRVTCQSLRRFSSS